MPHLSNPLLLTPFGLQLAKLSVRDLHYSELKIGGLVSRVRADPSLVKANDWRTLNEYWERLQKTVDRGDPEDFKPWAWYLSSEKEIRACAKRWKGAKVIAVSHWNPGSNQENMLVHDRTADAEAVRRLEPFFVETIQRDTEFNYFAKLGGLTFIATHA